MRKYSLTRDVKMPSQSTFQTLAPAVGLELFLFQAFAKPSFLSLSPQSTGAEFRELSVAITIKTTDYFVLEGIGLFSISGR